MPVPSAITDLSQTAGSNSPAGSESPALLDDYTRTVFSFIAKLRDGQGLSAPVDLASAATTDIGAATSPIVRITGTTTITSFGANYAGPRFLTFAGALTLTHNATSLILPGGANINTAAGDCLIAMPNGSTPNGWRVVAYQVAALVPGTASSATTLSGTVPIANGGTGQTTGAAAIAALFGTRADVASASTVDLTSVVSSINITGTTTITAFTIAVGRVILVRFNASLTLTNNASVVTQTGANIVTQAGDTCILRATAANVVEVLSYTRAIPQAIGDGQTLQNVGGSRALSTTYTNTTGRAIVVYVTINAGGASNVNVLLDGNVILQTNVQASLPQCFSFVVRPSGTYRVDASTSIAQWWELR